MRIAVDARPAARAMRTGTETYALEVLKALAQRDSRNEYLLFADQPLPPAELRLPPNFSWHYLHPQRAWSHRRLGPSATRAHPDLLFVPAHVLPLTFRGRSVLTVHDVGHRHVRRAYGLGTWLYLEASTRWAVRFATRLVAVSESTRHDLIRLYGADPGRVTTVPEGVGTDARAAAPEAVERAAARYGLVHPYFLFIGTLHPRKNLDFLGRAFERAFQRDPAVTLALAGQSRPGAEELDRYRGVRRLGFLPRPDLLALLTGARALVLPSLFEGFGLTAPEAMGCGTPVLAARTGALPEVVDDAGMLLPPQDLEGWVAALQRLATDPQLRTDLGERGRRRARHFSWDASAARLIEVFEGLGAHYRARATSR
jgi:glycosyltransferase involved in cell wall biosynthesis